MNINGDMKPIDEGAGEDKQRKRLAFVLPKELEIKGKIKKYEPNSIIVSRGDAADSVYFIKEGSVTGLREYANGSTYNYFELNSINGIVGLLEIMAGEKKYVATVYAATEVTMLCFKPEVIYQAIMENMQLLRRIVNILAKDLYKRSESDGLMYYMEGIDRVRFFLISRYEKYRNIDCANESVYIRTDYQEIANAIGMSIRTVGRNLQKLKEMKEIKILYKKIYITGNQYEVLKKKMGCLY